MTNIDQNTPPEFEDDVLELSKPMLTLLWQKHSLVARKLSIAIEQYENASSTEEYQQIGIIIRDAWIEFAQKLFRLEFVPEGNKIPGTSDVKAMLQYTIARWCNYPDRLIKTYEKVNSQLLIWKYDCMHPMRSC